MPVLMEQVYAPGAQADWQVPLYHRVYRIHNGRTEVHESDIPLMMAEGFRIVKQEEPTPEMDVELDVKTRAKRSKGQ